MKLSEALAVSALIVTLGACQGPAGPAGIAPAYKDGRPETCQLKPAS